MKVGGLTSSAEVFAAADQTVRRISEQYFACNLTIAELRDLARSPSADPLREFSEACRSELRSLRDKA